MAEEKKQNQKQSQKLSYEQLEAYAQQTTEQAKRIFHENQMLKQALDRANYDTTIKEIECALKCLDHAEMFSPEFINAIVKRLEEVLTPTKEEPKDEAKEATDSKKEE